MFMIFKKCKESALLISNGLGKKAFLFPRPFIIQLHNWTFFMIFIRKIVGKR